MSLEGLLSLPASSENSAEHVRAIVPNVKALTLTQPWATLVASGYKHIETRSWFTDYRGPLAIHASKRFHEWARELCDRDPYAAILAELGYERAFDLPVGCVVAVGRLVGCEPTAPSGALIPPNGTWEHEFGDYRPGRYMWMLDQIKPIEPPIAARGSLGLWDFEHERLAA